MDMLQQRIVRYSLSQSLALTTATMSVAMSAIVGLSLSSTPSLSTLPYGAQFLAIMLTSYLMSIAMRRFGRKPVFIFAAACIIVAGVVGAYSTITYSFGLNILAHMFLGAGLSGCAYFRFAVTDGLVGNAKAKALSLVTFGGIAAAFIGPYLVAETRSAYVADFSISYFLLCIIGVLLMLLISSIPGVSEHEKTDANFVEDNQIPVESARIEVMDNQASLHSSNELAVKFPIRRFLAAIYASGFGYMLMGMLMMQSALLLSQMGIEFDKISFVIQCHVVAMFLPSLFMGKLITRYGAENIILGGYAVMLASIIMAINYSGYLSILYALIGIGVGWNMLYVGGSTMVALLPGDASKLQGINESAVAVLQTIGAFAAGVLFAQIGWVNSNWLAMVLLLPGLLLLLIAKINHQKIQPAY